MKSQIQIDRLDEKKVPRAILNLIWPIVIQEASFSILGMATTVLIGHLGAAAITAQSLGENIVHLPEVFFAGISIGGTAIVARHIGAREPEKANRTLQQAILLAVILGAFFAGLWWLLADQLLLLFRAQPDVVALGRDYIRVNAPCLIFFFILYGGEAMMRGSGDTRTPMLVTLVQQVIGTGLALVFINGFWFIPAMGVLGAGIARAIASFIGATIIVTLLVKGRGHLKYNLKTAFQFDFSEIRRIFKIGLPALLEQAQMRAAMTVYQIIISGLGTTVYAAHALTMRVEEFAFMPSFGFSVATTALVGQALGAGRPDLAERSAKQAVKYCIISMVTLGVLTFLLGGRLLSLFINDPEVTKLGTLGLQIWAFAMPGMAINNTLSGGLRGAGDTRWVLYLSTIGVWTVRVGGGALMVYVFDLGVVGAWAGAIADQTIRAVIFWLRFRTGRWKEIKI